MCAKCTQIVTQNLLLRRMYFRLNISVADAVSPSSRFMCNLQWLQLFQTHGLNNDEENKLKLWIVAGLKLSSRKIEKKKIICWRAIAHLEQKIFIYISLPTSLSLKIVFLLSLLSIWGFTYFPTVVLQLNGDTE